MKIYLFIALLFFLSACTSPNTKEQPTDETQAEENQPTVSQRIYYLQHKLIANWLFESEGGFFFDMQVGNFGNFVEAAAEIVSPEYAYDIAISPVEDGNAILFTFPEPEVPANCFFSLIRKDDDGFSYYTYEKTISFGEESISGVVGGWDKEGNHQNYGPRNYQSQEEFVQEILGIQ